MCENKELSLPLLQRFIGDHPDLTRATQTATKFRNVLLAIDGDTIQLDLSSEELEDVDYILTSWNTNAHIKVINTDGRSYVKVDRLMGEPLREGVEYVLIRPIY